MENQQYLASLASEAQALLEKLVLEERAIKAEEKQCRQLRLKGVPRNMSRERRQEYYKNLSAFRADLRSDYEALFQKLDLLFVLEKLLPLEGRYSHLRKRIEEFRKKYELDILCCGKDLRAAS